MSWQAVARKDFQDSIRSYWLIGLTVLFVLLVSAVAYGVGQLLDNPGAGDVLNVLNGIIITTFVPLLALIISFSAVSGERESGSLKVLLALPHSREDVVLGKFLGRSASMAVAVVVGFVLPGIVLAVTGSFDPVTYFGYIVWVVLLAVVFIAIGVGISANGTTQWRSVAAMLGFYLVFVIFWGMLQLAAGAILFLLVQQNWPGWMPYSLEETALGLKIINPTGAFKILTSAFLNGYLFEQAPNAGQGSAFVGSKVYAQSTQLAAALMLLFWAAAPLALGLYRFREADL